MSTSLWFPVSLTVSFVLPWDGSTSPGFRLPILSRTMSTETFAEDPLGLTRWPRVRKKEETLYFRQSQG